MKIDTSILRNELATPVTICGSEEFKRGWHSCSEELENAIQRAEKKTPQKEDDEDKWYWKGRADGLEYAIDTLQNVFELISEGRQ